MSRHFDVLIVGAGAAGLAAGRLLTAAGRRVAIVEARTRIGGRICTQHAGCPLELGAEFIHGLPTASWSLIREAGLATYELQGRPYSFDGKALQSSAPLPDDAFTVVEEMTRWWNRQTSLPDLSFAQYLASAKLPQLVANRAIAYVEGFNAADHASISVAALARQQLAEDDISADRIFHVKDGYDKLPAFLAREFGSHGGELLLGHEVREVEWGDCGVHLRGQQPAFSLSARHAVITLPLGVLKSNAVRFLPEIATSKTSLTALSMGPVLRISLLFDRAFWLDCAAGMGFLFSRDELIPTWWTSHPNLAPILTAWVGGAGAIRRLGNIRGQALIDAALEQLGRMFKLPASQLRSMLQQVASHDWNTDRYSLGAYSYAAVGGLDAATHLAAPIDDVLYLAGEHTDPEGQWGTVHAALASGTRAAEQILLSSA